MWFPLGVATLNHLTLSLASFCVTPTLLMSFFITSMNLLCVPSPFLLPGSSIFDILCPTYPLSQPCLSVFVSKMFNLSRPPPFWLKTLKSGTCLFVIHIICHSTSHYCPVSLQFYSSSLLPKGSLQAFLSFFHLQ